MLCKALKLMFESIIKSYKQVTLFIFIIIILHELPLKVQLTESGCGKLYLNKFNTN